MSTHLYRTEIGGDEAIVAERPYSLTYTIWTPDFTWETLKAGLDALLATLQDRYALRTISYVLWEEPASIEIWFVWSATPGQDLNWFSREIEQLATEYYMNFELQEIAAFLPRFPWWLLFLALGIGAVAIVSELKEKKK